MQRRAVLVAALAALAGLAAGCSGSGDQRTPAEVLATAKTRLDAAKTVHIVMTGDKVPPGVNAVLGAEGDAIIDPAQPRFAGTVTGRLGGGLSAAVDLIAVGDTVWTKLLTPNYVKADLVALGAPNPASFFDPKTGLSTLLTATENPQVGDRARSGSDIVTTYTGTLPGRSVRTLLLLGDDATPVQVTWRVTEAGDLRSARLTGTFYGAAGVAYEVNLTRLGAPVTITAPE